MGLSSSVPRPSSACPVCFKPVSEKGMVYFIHPTVGGAPVGPCREHHVQKMSPVQFCKMVMRERSDELMLTPCCGQVFHFGCLAHWVVGLGNTRCPLCRDNIRLMMTFLCRTDRGRKVSVAEVCLQLGSLFLVFIGAWSVIAYIVRCFL